MVKFLVRQVDAWADPDGGWTYNTVWNIGEVRTKAKNEKKAIINYLRRKGIVFKQGCTRINFDGDNYEIADRKTGMPLFDAVFMTD